MTACSEPSPTSPRPPVTSAAFSRQRQATRIAAVVRSSHNLPQITAAAVLVAWAMALVALAAKVSAPP